MGKRNRRTEREVERFNSPEEANSGLHDAARVINMKERERARAGKLPELPKLPKSKKARPTRPCACGCGESTKATWVPGHDSYVRAWAIRVEREVVKIGDVPEAQRKAVEACLRERTEDRKKTAQA